MRILFNLPTAEIVNFSVCVVCLWILDYAFRDLLRLWKPRLQRFRAMMKLTDRKWRKNTPDLASVDSQKQVVGGKVEQ